MLTWLPVWEGEEELDTWKTGVENTYLWICIYLILNLINVLSS